MSLRERARAAILACALACGCTGALGGTGALGCTGETGVDAAIDAHAEPYVELGTGLGSFEVLPDEGAELELVHGPQGGWHVHLSMRMRGITPTSVVYEVTRLSDGRVLAVLPLGVREGTFVPREDGLAERVGDFAILEITDPSELVGEDVRAVGTLYDADARAYADARVARVIDLVP